MQYEMTRENSHCTLVLLLSILILGAIGCGATKSYTATEQLLISDAVDSTIAKMDFRPLAGEKVFVDTSYLTSARSVPGIPNNILGPQNLINADYVVSSVRQQLVASGCMLEEKKEEADLVVEVRIGALGTDGHSVTYGLPASNMMSAASSVLPGTSAIPAIPELSFAKKELKSGAAKIAVFAYDRLSHEAVWQSGIEQSNSNARDTWFLGIGPIQQGTIYKSPRFAGRRLYGKTADDHMAEGEGIPIRDRYLFARTPAKPKDHETADATNPPKPPEGKGAEVVRASATDSPK